MVKWGWVEAGGRNWNTPIDLNVAHSFNSLVPGVFPLHRMAIAVEVETTGKKEAGEDRGRRGAQKYRTEKRKSS